MLTTRDWIELDSVHVLPPAHATRADIDAWHIRRVIGVSETYADAADVLGISRVHLWELRKRYDLDIEPGAWL